MRELQVSLRFHPDDIRPVGTLVEDAHQVLFAYDSAFVRGGCEISPLRLPLRDGSLVAHRHKEGVPIPGVFNDARPDGWGLKLLHRAFQATGRARSSVSPLDELAYLGSHTMGALCFAPSTGPTGDLHDAVEFAALAAHAQQVWDDSIHEVLPGLVRAGASSGGARPKALIGLPADGQAGFRYGEGELPPGWDAWLVKFPTREDDPDVGRREAAWMAMAAEAGIEVPPFRALPLHGMPDAFAVRRFDRPGDGHRVHMLSGAGALDVDFRHAAADYEALLRVTLHLCRGDQSQAQAMFRLAAFNVASVNEDDHLKNVAWLMSPDGTWRLAPGFDLTYAPLPARERNTSVFGKTQGIGRADLLSLAEQVGIKPLTARRVVDEVVAATSRVRVHLDAAGCSHAVSIASARDVERSTARLRA